MPYSQHSKSVACAVVVAIITGAMLAPARGSEFGGTVTPFLKRHCFSCHGEEVQEGDLRLDELPAEISEPGTAALWQEVLSKLAAGEMPPEGEPRPAAADTKRTIESIQRHLIAYQRQRRIEEGRVVLRRLNRVEYQNTINDIFSIDARLMDLLPEDNSAHGFDNNAAALSLSSVLLERYLEAADAALDEAIETGQRRQRTKIRFSYKDERRVKDHKSYLNIDDAVVFFSSGYSPTEINQFRAPVDGVYRVRISAYAYQSKQPVTYRVYGEHAGAKHLCGYFDAEVRPTVAQFDTTLSAGKTLRVVPYGTWLTKWGEAESESNPGLAVQWVEIEGPMIDQWPPESQRSIFGDLAIDTKRRQVISADLNSDAKAILDRLLPRIFRRPVSEEQTQTYWKIIAAKLDQGYTFQEAVQVGLKAALCSPDFLYLRKASRRDEAQQAARLDDYAIASRLSYFLWSTMPDDELMRLAESRELRDPEVLRLQTERMLRDPRSAALAENFLGQWLNLRDIDFTTPDEKLYPEFDELLQISMVREAQLFWSELLAQDLSVLNFVDSDFTILNERLARHYGVPGVKGQTFRKVALPRDSPRGGVLTMAGVLKITANGTNTSPVMRGVWVNDNILGQPVPPPPANVPAVEPDIRGATSIRQQLARHREQKSCASCHNRIDPAGFALENFDVIGGWREHYRSIGEGQRVAATHQGRGVRYKRGLPVESADELADGRRFDDIRQFKQLLLQDEEQIVRCIAEKLLTYATGAGIDTIDRAEVDAIVTRLKGQEFGLRSMVHEVVQSEIFLSN